jgi:hypothetical protein
VSPTGLVLVFVLALAVRLTPLLRTHGFTAVHGPEDGSYFSASAHLLHGVLPYRDVAFGQPPGIAVLLLPFTALATVTGDVAALATARCAIVVVGSVNAVLVALVLRRVTPQWAIPAGILYAVWRLPSAAERTVALEPLLTLGLLTALLLLGVDDRDPTPPPRRLAASGASLGLAAAVTLWAAPAAALVAGYVLVRRGIRAAVVWSGGAIAALIVLAGPPAAAAPGAFVRQAVLGALQLATDATLSDRLRRFSDVARLGAYDIPQSVDVMVATCVVVALAALVMTAWWQKSARLIVLLLVLQCAMVVTAPDYTVRRFAAAPTLVLAAAVAAHQLLPSPWTGRFRGALAALTATTTVVLALTAVHNVVPRPPDATTLRAFAADHRCVWFQTASEAILAQALTPQLERRCAVPVDRVTDLQSLGEQLGDLGREEARRSPGLQARFGEEIAAADGVVIPTDGDDSLLDPPLLAQLREQFTSAGTFGRYTMWTRRS